MGISSETTILEASDASNEGTETKEPKRRNRNEGTETKEPKRRNQNEGTGTKEPERRNQNEGTRTKEQGTLAPGAAPAAV